MKKHQDLVSHTIRFPSKLHRKLSESASSHLPPRSFNSEILTRLFNSFKHTDLSVRLAKLEQNFGQQK